MQIYKTVERVGIKSINVDAVRPAAGRAHSIFIASIRESQRNRCRNAIERKSAQTAGETREIAIGLQLFHPRSKISELLEKRRGRRCRTLARL